MIEPLGLSLAELFTQPVVVSVFASMLVAYTILRRAFAQPYSMFSHNPAIAAHGIVFCLPFIYLACKGIHHWYFDPSLAAMDRQFGYHAGAQRIVDIPACIVPQVAVMVGVQLYDIPSSLLIGGVLASPNFVAHHIIVLMLAIFALHYRFALYYGVFFMGVIELSTPILAFVDLFRDFPKFAAVFPITNEIFRAMFALAFFAVRIILWLPASIAFWRDTAPLIFLEADERHRLPRTLVVFWLMVHLWLTLLQWHWGIKIARAAYMMLIGDKSARENEAKGA